MDVSIVIGVSVEGSLLITFVFSITSELGYELGETTVETSLGI